MRNHWKTLTWVMSILLLAAALVAVSAPGSRAEGAKRAGCELGKSASKSYIQAVSSGHYNIFKTTYYYADCTGFDRISYLRQTIYRSKGDCGTLAERLVKKAKIARFILNPDAIGDWNPPAWTPRCRRGQHSYSHWVQPPGDGYEYVFAHDSRGRRCSATKVTVDWRVDGSIFPAPPIPMTQDSHYRIPSVCLDGR